MASSRKPSRLPPLRRSFPDRVHGAPRSSSHLSDVSAPCAVRPDAPLAPFRVTTSGTSSCSFPACLFLIPSVGLSNLNHYGENVVPGLRILHDRIWKHTTVPADVRESPGGFSALIPHPRARIADDVELAVGIERQAVSSRFIVRAGSFHRAVVLRHVKVR